MEGTTQARVLTVAVQLAAVASLGAAIVGVLSPFVAAPIVLVAWWRRHARRQRSMVLIEDQRLTTAGGDTVGTWQISRVDVREKQVLTGVGTDDVIVTFLVVAEVDGRGLSLAEFESETTAKVVCAEVETWLGLRPRD